MFWSGRSSTKPAKSDPAPCVPTLTYCNRRYLGRPIVAPGPFTTAPAKRGKSTSKRCTPGTRPASAITGPKASVTHVALSGEPWMVICKDLPPLKVLITVQLSLGARSSPAPQSTFAATPLPLNNATRLRWPSLVGRWSISLVPAGRGGTPPFQRAETVLKSPDGRQHSEPNIKQFLSQEKEKSFYHRGSGIRPPVG
jgi:hypothetical protein